MGNFDDMKLAVESISGGRNTVILDDLGKPSIVFPFVKQKYSDLISGGTQETLPCFIVDGQEKDVVYISKFQNIVKNDRAYSLPLKDPKVYITFDEALQACRNKGNGWHLLTGGMWQAVALWCKKNGTMPHGNNSYGCASENSFEKGVPTYKEESGRVLRTATGSGPATWNHDFTDSGISDLNGNVWEWTADMRLKNGEINIIPYGNAMKLTCNMGPESTEWKAILPNGTLVNPGTAGTLKYDNSAAGDATKTSHAVSGTLSLSDVVSHPMYTGSDVEADYGYVGGSSPLMQALTAKTGLSVPQILKAYGLFPVDADLGGDGLWVRNYGERLPLRGGDYGNVGRAGVFALNLSDRRSYGYHNVGFRAAFVSL